MAELSIFWETISGTGDSNVAGYSDTLMFQALRSFFSRTANLGGVAPDFQNELAVTGSASPLAVNTGAGMAYGIPYFNSASVSIVIPTPAAQTRIDRIVLRASWAAKTVRITRIAGTEGAGAPAITQTAGATWDIPLAQVSITTGAVLTLTDQREWLVGIGDNTVDVTKLADDAVSNAKLANVAQNTIKGRVTASTGDPEDLTKAQALSVLNVADGADVTGTAIATATAKTSLVAADTFPLSDSAASGALKKVTLTNLAVAVAGTSGGRFMVIPLMLGVIGQSYGAALPLTAKLHAYLDTSKLPAGCTVKLGVRIGSSNTMVGTYQINLQAEKIAGSLAQGSSINLNGKATQSYTLGTDFRAGIAALGDGPMIFSCQEAVSASAGLVDIWGVEMYIEW